MNVADLQRNHQKRFHAVACHALADTRRNAIDPKDAFKNDDSPPWIYVQMTRSQSS